MAKKRSGKRVAKKPRKLSRAFIRRAQAERHPGADLPVGVVPEQQVITVRLDADVARFITGTAAMADTTPSTVANVLLATELYRIGFRHKDE